jgi:uncharacterized protein YndB with AHSA1/START domain
MNLPYTCLKVIHDQMVQQALEKAVLGSRVIEKKLLIKATPERIFQALTEKKELEHWLLSRAEVDLRVGGTIRFEWNRAGGIRNVGKIVALEPPQRLSYTWEALEPHPTTVTFALIAQSNGTLLHLMHTGIGKGHDWGEYYTSRKDGWDIHLTNLANWLEMGTEKPW